MWGKTEAEQGVKIDPPLFHLKAGKEGK